MKILLVGLGAIGQRHLRNLCTILGPGTEFLAYRVRGLKHALTGALTVRADADIEQEFGLRVSRELDAALAEKPDCAFICNPSSLHVQAATAAAKAGCHLFIEKPLSHSMEGVRELEAAIHQRGTVAMVGFQFRFHPGLAAVKRLIDEQAIGRIVHAHAHWGEFLPGWHPYEDFKSGYAARADLGGGVILTLCHPLDYLRWLVGEVEAVQAMTASVGGFGLDVEDTADIMLRFRSGCVGSVHLDYVQRPPAHWLQITGERGVIRWDNADGVVHTGQTDAGAWTTLAPPDGFDRNSMFLAEARHFMDAVAGRANVAVGLDDGIRALELALAARESASRGEIVRVRI